MAEPRWTPITERPPTGDGEFLVYLPPWGDEPDCIVVAEYDDGGWSVDGDVTHWMPLPAVPDLTGEDRG